MSHPIHRVVSFEDQTEQVIDFRPVLEGAIFGPLRDPELFRQVQIDLEAHTLVWPNGADFDPATLYDWPHAGQRLAALAHQWAPLGRTSAA